ncbi:SESN3-like protein, partial [Mya arenaria]
MDDYYRDVTSLRFLHPVSNRDRNVRRHAMDGIIQTMETWLTGNCTPFNSLEQINGNSINGNFAIAKLQERLPDLLRLLVSCPFKDKKGKGKGVKIPKGKAFSLKGYICKSYTEGIFAAQVQITPIDTKDDHTQMLFIDAFLQNNRLDHVTQVMGYHPHYLECFLRTQQFLLRGDGPLPYHFRHYIAIMAAGRHQCSYLINLHVQEFILAGGDPTWLNGLQCIPQKLRDLYEVNKILAHRPWLISSDHIAKLTNGKDNWSVSELVHALILLSHFHALSSFVYGCGITPEVDHEGGYTYNGKSSSACKSPCHNNSPSSSFSESGGELGISVLMERMKRLTETDSSDMTSEELLQQFENVENQSAEIAASAHIPAPKKDVLKFIKEPDFVYQDFAKRSNASSIPSFRAQEYTWEDHGFSMANRYYSEIGTLLDDKFTCAYNLTYYTMGDKMNVDTTMYRRAVWNYIHIMYGIRHDDYNYAETNQMLERNMKAYIKTVTCYPERLTKKEYDNVMKEFKHSEKYPVKKLGIII